MIHLIAQTTQPYLPAVPTSWTDFIEKFGALVVSITALIGVLHNTFFKASASDVKTLAQASPQSATLITPAIVAKVNQIAGTGDGSVK